MTTVSEVSELAERAALGIVLDNPKTAGQVFARVKPIDFTGPNGLIAEAIHGLRLARKPFDAGLVAAELNRRGMLSRAGGQVYVASLTGEYTSAALLTGYVDEIVTTVRRRRTWEIMRRGQDLIETGEIDPVESAQVIRDQLQGVLDSVDDSDEAPPQSLREFLDVEESEYDWVIPDLLERSDRAILTGPEGIGKSELFRQIGIAAAAGVHPFTHKPIPQQRVLFVDCENAATQIRRGMRRLAIKARQANGGDGADDTAFIEARPEGLDLMKPADAEWLVRVVSAVQPALLLTGSLYRLHTSDPSDETAARAVTAVIDRCRAASNCAVILEAHTGHSIGSAGERNVRPIGSSLWLRWPEFGYGLRPVKDFNYETRIVDLIPFRGDRAERSWPQRIKAGGDWPWEIGQYERFNDAGGTWHDQN